MQKVSERRHQKQPLVDYILSLGSTISPNKLKYLIEQIESTTLPLPPKTQQHYASLLSSAQSYTQNPSDIPANTYWSYKASLDYMLYMACRTYLIERAVNEDSKHRAIQRIFKLKRTVEQFYAIKPSFTQKMSKKQANQGLRKGWYDEFVSNVVSSATQYKTQILIAVLTGLRPDEFGLGVKCFVNSDSMVIRIKGAKQKSDQSGNLLQGMPERTITYQLPSNDAAIQALLNQARNPSSPNEIVVDSLLSKRGFSESIRRCGNGLVMKDDKPQVFSAYNLRHAFASRLKKAKVADKDISRALGHLSMKTKGHYGNYNAKHVGGVVPSKIGSSHEPRPYQSSMSQASKAAKVSNTPPAPAENPSTVSSQSLGSSTSTAQVAVVQPTTVKPDAPSTESPNKVETGLFGCDV